MSVQSILREKWMGVVHLYEVEHLFGFDYIVAVEVREGQAMPVRILSRQTAMSDETWVKFQKAQIATECEQYGKSINLWQECQIED